MPALGEKDNAWSPGEACLRFEADLSACLEGEDRPAVSAHAAECVFCAAVLADLRAIRSVARDLETVEPPESLWTGLRASLVQEDIIRTTQASEACVRFDNELASYLEGEDRAGVTAHAAECVFCEAVLTDLRAIRLGAADLAAEEPPARLWANIRAALVEEDIIRPARSRRWSWPPWILQPTPVAALAGLVVLGFLSLGPRVNWVRPQLVSRASVAVDPAVQQSVQEMEGAFRARTAALDPVIEAALRKDLESLDGEIRECRASIESQPDDGLAREYLAAAYTEKAQILASALDLDNH